MAKIEKNTLCGRALVRVKAIIEKNTIFGSALVRIRAEIEKKKPFRMGFGQKKTLWLVYLNYI